MKLALALIVLLFVVVVCHCNEDAISDDEIQELISDYNSLYKPSGNDKNAPIREMAMKTKELTFKYFKTVGIEIARHMCSSLDDIIKSLTSKMDNNNEI
ncbi:hypothetical protein PVAND_011217 [Polypedilum vanderplanki]|uniref:Uncharacterized protein n=1 Tax=Polypedilum vanderplanki TaxID=319348 RepID=A0A9J6CHX0_POLVA|nr:hypothetical protein PVAND_011217 [Polypedilum vanderplanki]